MALTCAIDICRAAAYVDTNLGDVILLEIAVDMAHEIKARQLVSESFPANANTFIRVHYIILATRSGCFGNPTMISTLPCIPSLWLRCIVFYLLRTRFRYSKLVWTLNGLKLSKLVRSVGVSLLLRMDFVSSGKEVSLNSEMSSVLDAV